MTSQTSGTILVVEEFRLLREAVAELLADALPGMTVLQAASVGEAMGRIPGQPLALAIVDAQVRGEEAFATVRRLHALDPRLPIIAFGLASEPAYELEARAAGAFAYIEKIAGPERIVRAARLVLAPFPVRRAEA